MILILILLSLAAAALIATVVQVARAVWLKGLLEGAEVAACAREDCPEQHRGSLQIAAYRDMIGEYVTRTAVGGAASVLLVLVAGSVWLLT